jgi:hypothetical protein
LIDTSIDDAAQRLVQLIANFSHAKEGEAMVAPDQLWSNLGRPLDQPFAMAFRLQYFRGEWVRDDCGGGKFAVGVRAPE